MAQRKTATDTKKPTEPQPTDPNATERYTVKREFWDSLLENLPPWGDEIIAIVLIVFGMVSFLALLNVSGDATISSAWSRALTGLFGYGSAVICAGILGLGVIILLPKLGIVIRFPTQRILAMEIAFLSLLGLLHLTAGETELRNLARLGRGGGQVGWALSSLFNGVFGTAVGLTLFSIIFVVSRAVVFGVRRDHITYLLRRASARLRSQAKRYQPPPRPRREAVSLDVKLNTRVVIDASGAPSLQKVNTLDSQRAKAYSIMLIRPDFESLPPSMRPGAAPSIEEMQPDPAEHPVFSRADSVIGTVQEAVKGSPQMVKRPDGRLKRYFTIAGMKEPKQIAKRDEALPPLNLLVDTELSLPDEEEINTNVVLIENTLLEFDIDVDVVDVRVGPTVTQYAVQPFREKTDDAGEVTFSRTRISKIASLTNDLALALSAKRLRLETPVPGRNYVGIEVPNRNPSTVALRSVYESKAYYDLAQKRKSPLVIPLGRDVAGDPVAIDLAAMPHLLIAGTTGSGKSVAIAAMATALVLDNTPDMIKMVMLDPKMVELSRFNGLPHLLGPVETDPERIIGVLKWCTREMDRRYKVLEDNAARNIDVYNARLGRRRRDEYLPYIVILVDEIGDLMMSHPDETERTITRLAQMARAVGMHMVIATQRPSVDVITGLIKANFPSRIAFAVASGVDSRVIIDAIGAENLVGKGDMLYQAADAMAPQRIQGCYVSDDEVRLVVHHWRMWAETHGMMPDRVSAPWQRGLTRREFLSETDPMLEQAIELVIATQEASASLIQRRLNLGYPRAARIIDLLEELGVIGPAIPGGRNRDVLIAPGGDPFKDLIDRKMNGSAGGDGGG
ncbi:MAG: DNA translocase FtsK [Anaerolineae bacterium]|nr:DNA translocase FtsK [Anaerolineae bacterium]